MKDATWHASQFYGNRNLARIVRRYTAAFEALLAGKELKCILRNAFHVAAWIAHSPEDMFVSHTTPMPGAPLSTVDLLTKMLCARARLSLPERLVSVLRSLDSRISGSAQLLRLSKQKDSSWGKLRRALPKVVRDNSCRSSPPLELSAGSQQDVCNPSEEQQKPASMEHHVGHHLQEEGAAPTNVPAQNVKSLRLLQKQVACWNNLTKDSRTLRLSELRARMDAELASPEMCQKELRKVLRCAAAAMTAPRAKLRTGGDWHETCEITCEEFQNSSMKQDRCSEQQRIARSLVIEVLRLLPRSDLIEPIVSLVRNYIKFYEDLHGSLSSAASTGQWMKLRDLVIGTEDCKQHIFPFRFSDTCTESTARAIDKKDKLRRRPWTSQEVEALHQAVSALTQIKDGHQEWCTLSMSRWLAIGSQLGRSAISCKNKYRKLTDPRYHPLERSSTSHEYGLLPALMTAAMTHLGGKSTVPQILEHCRKDRRIQEEFSDRLNTSITKMSGTIREEPAWEAAIRRNMSSWCKATDAKANGHTVYEWTRRTRRRLAGKEL